MWKLAAIGFAVAAGLGPILTEVARGIVHRHRSRRSGIGGTQDVAAFGTFLTFACLGAAIACGGIWLLSR